MKLFSVSALLVLSFCGLKSQSGIGDDVIFIEGKELIVTDIPDYLQKFGYGNFFLDRNLGEVLFPEENGLRTTYVKLLGVKFTVSNVTKDSLNRYTYAHVLELYNPEIGIVYYKYDPGSDSHDNFPFEILGGIDYPENHFCKNISDEVDKFTKERRIITPLGEPISFTRVIDQEKSKIFLTLSTTSSVLNSNARGATILLSEGEGMKWENSKVNVSVNRNGEGYIYTFYYLLNEDDIKKLSTYKVTDFRLFVFDQAIVNGEKYMQYIKCIVSIE